MAEERGPQGFQQVDDRPPHSYGAGSEGGGEEIFAGEPWVPLPAGDDPESARARVESREDVMPPQPAPVDRHAERRRENQLRWGLPVAASFGVGLIAGILSRPLGRGAALVSGLAWFARPRACTLDK